MTVTDTASAVTSKLFDLILNGISTFSIDKNAAYITPQGITDFNNFQGGANFQGGGNYSFIISNTSNAILSDFTSSLTTLYQYSPPDNSSSHAIKAFTPAIYVPNTVTSDIHSGFVAINYLIDVETSGQVDVIYGTNSSIYRSGGTTTDIYLSSDGITLANNTNTTNLWGFQPSFNFHNSNLVTWARGFAPALSFFGTGTTVTTYVGYWQDDLSTQSQITNKYAFWYDGPGVVRIKEEGATLGGVYAWYNPAFTKYTPGAVNFERGVLQWNTGNLIEIGAEAGGTGTLRVVSLKSADGAKTTSKTWATAATTVSGLPSAATVGAGARGFVTDATLATFGTTVIGSGSTPVPVYSDGTNWKIG